jgi:hypothetical protein
MYTTKNSAPTHQCYSYISSFKEAMYIQKRLKDVSSQLKAAPCQEVVSMGKNIENEDPPRRRTELLTGREDNYHQPDDDDVQELSVQVYTQNTGLPW